MRHAAIDEWNNAAEIYAKRQSEAAFAAFNREFIKTLITDISGHKVLDAGCGDGYYSNWLQQQGADVIGCDGSSEMLRLARTNYPSIQFDSVDLLQPLPYADQQFDMVLCNLVLMDIEPIEPFIAEVSRVLKDGGVFLFNILHPGFYVGTWEVDKAGQKTYRKIANYIKPRSQKTNFWGETTHYHRPLSFYFNLLSANHLRLDQMFEPPMSVDDNPKPVKFLIKVKISLVRMVRTLIIKYVEPALNETEEPFERIPLFLFARFVKRID